MTLISIKVKRLLKLLTVEFVSAGILFILSVLLFTFLANEVVIEKEDNFDISTYQIMATCISPVKTKVAGFITFFGSGYFLVPAYCLLIFYFFKRNNNRYSLWITAVALISLLSGFLFKEIFQRPRPVLPLISGAGGHSFPSGHSLGGFTFGGLLIFLVWQSTLQAGIKWTASVLLLSFGVLIGLSRIYLRVHYASDVVGSLLLTTTWLSLSFISMRIIEKRL